MMKISLKHTPPPLPQVSHPGTHALEFEPRASLKPFHSEPRRLLNRGILSCTHTHGTTSAPGGLLPGACCTPRPAAPRHCEAGALEAAAAASRPRTGHCAGAHGDGLHGGQSPTTPTSRPPASCLRISTACAAAACSPTPRRCEHRAAAALHQVSSRCPHAAPAARSPPRARQAAALSRGCCALTPAAASYDAAAAAAAAAARPRSPASHTGSIGSRANAHPGTWGPATRAAAATATAATHHHHRRHHLS